MSRLENLKKQHPNLNITLFDIITAIDPTGSYKYTEFLIKQLKNNDLYSSNSDEFKGYLATWLFEPGNITTLNEFERHSKQKRIKENDISKYKDFESLKSVVKLAEEIEEQKKSEKQIKKIHWTDEWSVLVPLTYLASKRYGSGTTWCTTQEKYWKKYLNTHKLIYVINKYTNFKLAFSREIGSIRGFNAWTEVDVEVSPLYFDLPDEIFLKIKKELKKGESTHQLAKELGIVDFGNETLLSKDFKISNYPNVITTGDNLLFNGNDTISATYNGNDTISATYNSNFGVRNIEEIVRNIMNETRYEGDELP
jgi:hypothetical protein